MALDPDSKSTLSSNPFERTIQLAMTFGGDSDTICSMAGALAGARYGEAGIPGSHLNVISSIGEFDKCEPLGGYSDMCSIKKKLFFHWNFRNL